MFYVTNRKGFVNRRSILDDFFTPFTTTSSMKADVIEKDSEYLFKFEIPGFKKEDIRISFEDKYLVIEAKKEEQVKEENAKYLYNEIATGEVKRSFYLENVDEDNMKANYIDGILTLTVAKKEPNAKRFIEIEA